MKLVLTTLKKVIFWSYERGSWQYDALCVLILAFIFLLPTGLFVNRDSSALSSSHRPLYVSLAEVSQADSQEVDKEINSIISRKYGHAVVISRIEADKDASGNIKGYFIWEKE